MNEQDLEWQRYHSTLPDGGPWYAETNLDHFIAEPWNAVSSLFFLIPAVYWAIRIRGHVKEQIFLACCIPLLVIGGMGSTLFHAFRSSYYLLVMDFLPIAILTFSVSIYMWQKVTQRWWLTVIIALTAIGLRLLLFRSGYFSHHTSINISYAISGTMILVPALIVLIRTRFYRVKSFLLALGMFAVALFFREADAAGMFSLPMGTHFLWHTACAVGAHYIADYLYHFRQRYAKI